MNAPDPIVGLKRIAAELHGCRLDLAADNERARRRQMDGYDQAAAHAQQLAWMQEAERVLSESTQRLLTVDEARLLAWAANLQFNPNVNRRNDDEPTHTENERIEV